MVHQPSGGFSGQASDIERHAEDIIKMKRRLNEVYVHHTGQPYETIERTLDRDYFMTAEQAKEFGLIDRVMTKREDAEAAVMRGSKQPHCSRVETFSAGRFHWPVTAWRRWPAVIWPCGGVQVDLVGSRLIPHVWGQGPAEVSQMF